MGKMLEILGGVPLISVSNTSIFIILPFI